MLILKRIFLNSKRLTYYISTSAVNSCDKPRKSSPIIDSLLREKDGKEKMRRRGKTEYPEKIISPDEKKNAKNSLNALLESISVETDQNQEEKDTELRDMLKMQIGQRKPKKQTKKNLGALLYEAADTVAKDLGGDINKTKEDLLQHLEAIEVKEELEVPEQLQFDRSEHKVDTENALRALEEVLASERLKIFSKESAEQKEAEVKLNIWDRLEEEELAYLGSKPPRNQLEEWILWTEQGKLWQFPIDNDQGMEREGKVEFTQHVFLEEHLEPWCPEKGPLKKFMDLVLVGLSKNPYLTVEDKKEHIFWYRDYFEKKKKLLQELGAFGTVKEIGESVSPLPEEKL